MPNSEHNLGSFWFARMALGKNGMESGMALEWNEVGIVIFIPMFGFTEESIQ